jgi:predicted acyltransferase
MTETTAFAGPAAANAPVLSEVRMSSVDPVRADASPQRLLSIDALRGFDMFWIVGGDAVFEEILKWGKHTEKDWSNWPAVKEFGEQLQHVAWRGFHFEDLIFPLFVFLVGVVLPFSLAKLSGPGISRRAAYGRILRRTLLLYVLGLIYYGKHGVLDFYWSDQRYLGVLQRIAICYGIAAIITLHTRAPGQLAILIAILVGYWALLTKVPVPGGTAGDLTPEGSLASYVDQHYLYGKIWTKYYDNEGLLSTLPAVGTALLGVLTGQWLRSGYGALTKTAGMAVAGAACLAAGLAWSDVPSPVQFPVIKNLWTSSFVLVAGGWSLLLLSLFYGIIDGLGWQRWSFFFVVIGSNAILIYLMEKFLHLKPTADHLFGGLARWSETVGFGSHIVIAAGILLIQWLILYVLYRHRIFLRV